jgi:hypothetical protein
VAKETKHIIHASRGGTERVANATRRLLTATVGFSAAYFFDPEQGPARRQHALDFIRRPSRSRPDAAASAAALDLPRIGLARSGPRPTFQRAVVDIRAMSRA